MLSYVDRFFTFTMLFAYNIELKQNVYKWFCVNKLICHYVAWMTCEATCNSCPSVSTLSEIQNYVGPRTVLQTRDTIIQMWWWNYSHAGVSKVNGSLMNCIVSYIISKRFIDPHFRVCKCIVHFGGYVHVFLLLCACSPPAPALHSTVLPIHKILSIDMFRVCTTCQSCCYRKVCVLVCVQESEPSCLLPGKKHLL